MSLFIIMIMVWGFGAFNTFTRKETTNSKINVEHFQTISLSLSAIEQSQLDLMFIITAGNIYETVQCTLLISLVVKIVK